MRALERRVRKLEGAGRDATGLVPYSEAWFDFYEARWASLVDEEGSLIDNSKFDIPLAVIDRAIQRADEEEAAARQ